MHRAKGDFHPAFAEVARTFEGLLPERRGGASLVVMHRGETVVDLSGGTRDDLGRPFDADTVSLSFSTTKGVASTLLHVLASRGEIDYDRRVSHYWPAFAANGKEAITVRHVLTHAAGLYSIRSLVDDAAQMRDWDGMLARIECARPVHEPGSKNAYHGLTYGWLVGGIVEKVTGGRFADVLATELSTPLGLTGCYVGLPETELHRAARLVDRRMRPSTGTGVRRRPSIRARLTRRAVELATRAAGKDPRVFGEALAPRGIQNFDWTDDATLMSCIPAASGTFDARSLARIYAMIANGGELDGVRLLSNDTVKELSTIQSRRRDEVLPFSMHWRLGYHRILSLYGPASRGFGHFGFGGSGAFADPDRKLSVGYVLNYGVGTPFGDSRMWRISAAALRAADRRGLRR